MHGRVPRLLDVDYGKAKHGWSLMASSRRPLEQLRPKRFIAARACAPVLIATSKLMQDTTCCLLGAWRRGSTAAHNLLRRDDYLQNGEMTMQQLDACTTEGQQEACDAAYGNPRGPDVPANQERREERLVACSNGDVCHDG